MATSTTKLPYAKRVQNAVDKIGTFNGTKLPDPVLPSDIPQSNNEEVNAFYEKHARIRDYLVLDIIKRHVEGQHKQAKKEVLDVLHVNEDALAAGFLKSYTAGNVALTLKTTAPRSSINRAMLMTALMTRMDKLAPGARNLTLKEAESVVEAAMLAGKPPLSLLPSVTEE